MIRLDRPQVVPDVRHLPVKSPAAHWQRTALGVMTASTGSSQSSYPNPQPQASAPTRYPAFTSTRPSMPQTRPRTLDDTPHDVLYIIFRYLQSAKSHDIHGVKSQSVFPTSWLLDVALLCKSLSSHALDMLWHTSYILCNSDRPALYAVR